MICELSHLSYLGVGERVGDKVGVSVAGTTGFGFVGLEVGLCPSPFHDGLFEVIGAGFVVGLCPSPFQVGDDVGMRVGERVGLSVGDKVGVSVAGIGFGLVGLAVGFGMVGFDVG